MVRSKYNITGIALALPDTPKHARFAIRRLPTERSVQVRQKTRDPKGCPRWSISRGWMLPRKMKFVQECPDEAREASALSQCMVHPVHPQNAHWGLSQHVGK